MLGTLAWLNLAVVLGLPSFAVRRTRAEPVPAFVVMIISTICFMKLWSFWHCNQWLRCALAGSLPWALWPEA